MEKSVNLNLLRDLPVVNNFKGEDEKISHQLTIKATDTLRFEI